MNEFSEARKKQTFYEECALLAQSVGDPHGVRRYTLIASGWDYEANKIFKKYCSPKVCPNELARSVFPRGVLTDPPTQPPT